jgi:hypothetical protein
MIDYSPKLEAPLIAPMTDDGPNARQVLDVQLLLKPRDEREAPLINRAALVEARYEDWYANQRVSNAKS